MYKVLIVDDEELERKVLEFTLQNSGLPLTVVGQAASGREAIDKVYSLNPDLIIMDIKMPGIDGIEATRRIKELNPTSEVIILTAYGKFSYSQQAIRAQASDYLLKPVQPQHLIQAVGQALDRLERKQLQLGPSLDLSGFEKRLKSDDFEEGKRQLTIALEDFKAKQPNPGPAVLSSFGLRLLVVATQAVLSEGANPSQVTALEHDLAQELHLVASFEQMADWGEKLLNRCLMLLRTQYRLHDQAIVRKAMDYIESNYASNLTLNSVAAQVHLSPAYLSRIFTKKTGAGFSEYLTKVRLQRAKTRLRISDDTIDQIAAESGFNSNSYFTSVFKRYEGITPSEYRQQHHG